MCPALPCPCPHPLLQAVKILWCTPWGWSSMSGPASSAGGEWGLGGSLHGHPHTGTVLTSPLSPQRRLQDQHREGLTRSWWTPTTSSLCICPSPPLLHLDELHIPETPAWPFLATSELGAAPGLLPLSHFEVPEPSEFWEGHEGSTL